MFKATDTNESLRRFLHTFNSISNNKHAPFTSIKIKSISDKPWLTSGLKTSMKIRNNAFKTWRLTKNISFLVNSSSTAIELPA